jgi:hypothetical protein
MTQRRLHAAPPDYGIVEVDSGAAPPVFLIYRFGLEVARARSSKAAWALAEADRALHARKTLQRQMAAGSHDAA